MKAARAQSRSSVHPVALSRLLGIDPISFDRTGAFDAALNVDTPLFIDPALLRTTTVPELAGSYAKIVAHFSHLLIALNHSAQEGDIFWRQAEKMLLFPEVQGLCIGYSSGNTSGRGAGHVIASESLRTASAILHAGRKDPEIFEIMGLFQEGVGPDRLSDMAAGIIMPDLMAYTKRILIVTV